MPTTTKAKAFVGSVQTNSREWKVVEEIRNIFSTEVKTSDGEPKLNKAGEQQIRRANGDEVVTRLIKAVLVDASDATLEALASESKDPLNQKGEGPKNSTSEYIRSIIHARAATAPRARGKTAEEMTVEELEALLARKKAGLKAGKGTKDVAAI